MSRQNGGLQLGLGFLLANRGGVTRCDLALIVCNLKRAAIRIRIEPAREEKIHPAEACVDAFLIRLYAINLMLVDALMVAHELIIAARVFIAAAVQHLAFLTVRLGLHLNDQ